MILGYCHFILWTMLLLGLCSCDQISSILIEEFNSERSPQALMAQSPPMQSLPLEEQAVLNKEIQPQTLYLVHAQQGTLVAMTSPVGQFTLTLTGIGDSSISLSKSLDANAYTLNNLILFNQWSEGIIRQGTLILFNQEQSPVVINTLLTKPRYDAGSATVTLVLTPQDPIRSEMVSQPLSSPLLFIQTN